MVLLIPLQWLVTEAFLPNTTVQIEVERERNFAACSVTVAAQTALSIMVGALLVWVALQSVRPSCDCNSDRSADPVSIPLVDRLGGLEELRIQVIGGSAWSTSLRGRRLRRWLLGDSQLSRRPRYNRFTFVRARST